MNIVFMGTPEFAVPCLKALIDSGENVQAVLTQPDKPKGRGYKLTPPPVKELALTHNIPVYQPESLKKGEDAQKTIEILKSLSPDIIVVVAYGKILPKEVLDIPKHFCINVHASLLPKYRGAGPIQWSVLNGETETGVTTMVMAEGLDTGDMLMKASLKIGENETASELHDRLSELGAKLLVDTIKSVKLDDFTRTVQNDEESNYAPMLSKDLCPIDFSKSAREIHNQIRGLSDWPCATAILDGKRIKIFRSSISDIEYKDKQPGEIVDEKKFTFVCGDGKCINIEELQTDGGKRMKTEDYLRGNSLEKGTILL
ncbi:MAG TPA: methionyl-tRNA formyltransferase [Oscillospiraceae bacterium]|nr:methionyl-tRNA formyltransferase [Oscillospiraceae bacterium]